MPTQEPRATDTAEAIRHALRNAPGRVALGLPAPAGAAQRRVALHLLAEAGRAVGGCVLETADGRLLLTEAAAAEAARAKAVLARLFPAAPPERFGLPADAARLLALPQPRPPAPDTAAEPSPAGLEALADAAPLPALLRREGVLRIAPGRPRGLALLRLRLDAAALAPHLGPAAADPDLAAEAQDRLRARLLDLLAEPGPREVLLGAAPPVPLLIDLPTHRLPAAGPAAAGSPGTPPALYAALPLAEALDSALQDRRAALRQGGWGVALRGLDAAALALLAPEALPADLLLLRWSPAMALRIPTGALRRTAPDRLLLAGCDGPEALEWGLGLGISLYAGPWIETLMAATRMAACPHAAGCDRAGCAARAAAATPEGRLGCAAPALLGALVPP